MIYLRKKWWFSSSYVQPEDRFGTLDGFQATNAPTPLPSQGQFGSRSSRPAPVPSSSSRGGRLAVGGAVEVLLLVVWEFHPHYLIILEISFLTFFLSLSVSSQHHLNIIIRHLVIILTPISSESQSLILGHSFPKKGWPSSCSCSFWSPLAPTPPCTASVTRLRRCPSRCRAAVRWCGVIRTRTRTAMPRRRRMARMTWRGRWGWEGMGWGNVSGFVWWCWGLGHFFWVKIGKILGKPSQFGWIIPSGKHTKNYGKWQFLVGKSTINGHVQ